MAAIDILTLTPNKISRDLRGKFVLIYGEAKDLALVQVIEQ